MAYIRPNYQFSDIPMAFASMTNDQARDASAAALAGEIVAEDFYGKSVADAERYSTPIFSIYYVSRGFHAFHASVYIGKHVGANRYAEWDAQRAEIAA
jgi:hypothetical protein